MGALVAESDQSLIAPSQRARDRQWTMLVHRSVLVLIVLALIVPAAAYGKDGGDGDRRDVRVAGSCGHGAQFKLRLRSRDGEIRVELEVKHRGSGERWRVVIVHERRVAWRGSVRTPRSSRSFRVRRSVRDFDGADQVTARASGARGLTCQASATLPG